MVSNFSLYGEAREAYTGPPAAVAVPVMPRAGEAEDDEDVIYTDYKRSALPSKFFPQLSSLKRL